MIIYNKNVFKDDPINKLHFEDFLIPDNINIHLGNSWDKNIEKDPNKLDILIEFEQPNRFMHSISHNTTFMCEEYFDKILTINPTFVKNRNNVLGKELYQHVYFPYSTRYLHTNFEKIYDVVYTSNLDYFDVKNKIPSKSLIWIGNDGNIKDIEYENKIDFIRGSKIMLSHSVVSFKNQIDFMDTHKNILTHNDGIFEQHKARTIEAAFNKSIIIHFDTGQKIIEEFFENGVDFLYYKNGIIEEILNNYNHYNYLAENAYNKAINNFTTNNFYNDFIKPLI